VTEAEYIALVITELGDDTSGTLATNVPLYWTRRSVVTDLELRYLLVKRDAIDLLLGSLRDAIDRDSGGDSIKESQAFDHLLVLRKDVNALITAYPVADSTLTTPRSSSVGHLVTW
jgi:hypothetical protein